MRYKTWVSFLQIFGLLVLVDPVLVFPLRQRRKAMAGQPFDPNSFWPNNPVVEQEPAYERTTLLLRDRRRHTLWQDAASVSTTPIHRAVLGSKTNVSGDIVWKNQELTGFSQHYVAACVSARPRLPDPIITLLDRFLRNPSLSTAPV